MINYISINKSTEFNNIAICLDVGDLKVQEIGRNMNKLNEDAYMNGYNWDAFISYYLSRNAPELLEGLDRDPEGGAYFAHYQISPENEEKAERFIKIIEELIENEELLYEVIKNEGNSIKWDGYE